MPEKVAVLGDKSIDWKRLKRLVNASLIDVAYELDLEGRSKEGNFVAPLWVLNKTQLCRSVLASEASAKRLAKIQSIMGGPPQLEDALTVDAACRNGHLYVVTNDKTDFIRYGKRELLEPLVPGVKIVTLEELELALDFDGTP